MGAAAEPALAKPPNPAVENQARKFADVTYPLFEKIDFVKQPQVIEWMQSGSFNGKEKALLLKKILETGYSMDSKLVLDAAMAHERALNDMVTNNKVMPPLMNIEEIFVALARAIGSADAGKVFEVYPAAVAAGICSNFGANAMNALGGAGDVAASYKAFLDTATAVARCGADRSCR